MATAVLSTIPNSVLPFLPDEACKPGSRFLRVLLCFAAGALLGDVLLHLIPHLMGGHDHHSDLRSHENHSHGDSSVGIAVSLGYIFFFTCERVLYAMGGEINEGKKKLKSKGHAAKHGHTHRDMKFGGWLNLVADFTHNVTDGIAGKLFHIGRRLLQKCLLTCLNYSWSDVCL